MKLITISARAGSFLMINWVRFLLMVQVLMAFAVVPAVAQNQKPVPVCSQATFAALKEFPKLEYECPEGVNDFDDKILKLPARLARIRDIEKQLATFTSPAWWQARTDDLVACGVHGSAGQLTDEEKQHWRSGDYSLNLIGNHDMRVMLLDDPCYQTGFSGSNAFFLYRRDGKVFVSQVLNGYYSRVDNSVGLDFAKLNGQQIIEISTANSMPPSMVFYYFAIDPITNKAVPKRMFREGRKFTNEIYSDMLMADPKEIGLPASASELKVIVNGRLAPSFSVYETDEHGRVQGIGQRFRRIIYRWNGSYYIRGR